MRPLLRAELFKLRTTRTTVVLLLWMVGLSAFVVLLHVFAPHVETLTGRDGQLKVFGWGTSIAALFAALVGAMSITTEIRHGTIRPTLLATPKRARVVAAKVASSILAGVALGLLAEALAAALGSAGLALRGIDISLSAGDYLQLLAGGAAAAALWAAIGVGVGAIVRGQVGALLGLSIWLLLVETTLVGNVVAAGRFAPGAAAGAIAGAIQTQSATKLLSPIAGSLLLIVYATAAVAFGSIAIDRRDVG